MTLSTTATKKAARRGRPSDKKLKDFRKSVLYGKLLNAFPQYVDSTETGRPELNVGKLADALKKSRMGIYRWLHNNRMSPTSAKLLVKKSEGRLTLEDLNSHVF